MTIFYFTSTGNSLQIRKAIGGRHISIVQALKQPHKRYEDDSIGFVFPCYLHDIPSPVKSFLKEVTIKTDYVFVVLSYGMMDGAAPNRISRTFDSCGLRLDYLIDILMVDNYLPSFDMENQMRSLPKKRVEEHLEKIVQDIHSRRQYVKKASKLMGVLSKSIIWVFRQIENNRRGKLTVKDHCIKCGICAKVCPTDNITLGESVVFGDNCIICLACTHNCPQNAIRQKRERSKARYRNAKVSVKEITEANK